ncbi:MAG TPA: anti-sigma factor [Allosphingosinicella sp.]|jgi:anti-sigma-K factor RskA
MSDDVFSPEEESELLAAEYVLRLLDGTEMLAARGRLASDAAFAAAVNAWERRLEPMFEGVAEVAPPAGVWPRIEQAISAEANSAATAAPGDNVAQLRRRERLWKTYAAAMTAIAASLALFLGLRVAQPDRPVPQPQGPTAEAPALVAALSTQGGEATLSVTVSADRRSVLVTPTRMAAVSGHSHELWLIPASGTPVSLGVVAPDAPRRHSVPAGVIGEVRAQTTLAVSVEPVGGSTTGLPTGPVVATAPLREI